MKFPELKIIDKVPNKTRNTNESELYLVELDWSKVDSFKSEKKKEWYKKFSIDNPTKEQSEALTQVLDEVDWCGEILYPQKYKWIFDKYSQIKMPKSYYEECLYLSRKAFEEWNRTKPFDTNVREELLEVSIKYAELFFYLICDAVYIYNSTTSKNDDFYFYGSILFRSLMLYRFWKFQTGGGLLYDKSTSFIKRYTSSIVDRFDLEVKQDLIDNIKFDPFNLSDDYLLKSDAMKVLIEQKVRDNKLKNILN
jgi:hypothetical protein